jgi:DNA-directed RNA polymerase specialized sigma24 family protein
MECMSGPATSPTLLGRLRCNPNDQQAWNVFVERYGPKVYGWTHVRGLQEAGAQDVTQTVLVDLALQMNKLEYRPSGSFRAWLRTIAYRVWCDFLKARQRAAGTTGSDEIFTQLGSPAAGEDLPANWKRSASASSWRKRRRAFASACSRRPGGRLARRFRRRPGR